MASVLLTCNTMVPNIENPGTPALVYFDDGQWEIAYNGDVGYISESPKFVGSVTIIELLNELAGHEDFDEMDEVDGNIILFTQLTIETADEGEPVVALWDDGTAEIMCRVFAERMIDVGGDDNVYNFVTLPEFFDDLRKFTSNHAEGMFGRDDEDGRPPLAFGEEED
jgi:hypothetical protein